MRFIYSLLASTGRWELHPTLACISNSGHRQRHCLTCKEKSIPTHCFVFPKRSHCRSWMGVCFAKQSLFPPWGISNAEKSLQYFELQSTTGATETPNFLLQSKKYLEKLSIITYQHMWIPTILKRKYDYVFALEIIPFSNVWCIFLYLKYRKTKRTQ